MGSHLKGGPIIALYSPAVFSDRANQHFCSESFFLEIGDTLFSLVLHRKLQEGIKTRATERTAALAEFRLLESLHFLFWLAFLRVGSLSLETKIYFSKLINYFLGKQAYAQNANLT